MAPEYPDNVQKPVLKEATEIYSLIGIFSRKNKMLPRSLNAIYENLRDFWVYKAKGQIVGCCALHLVGWKGLAEIRSLAVKKRYQDKGIGARLVEACLEEARTLGVREVFALTFVPEFFKKIGFRIIDKNKLPHKIWSECVNCVYFPDCKEVALIKKISTI